MGVALDWDTERSSQAQISDLQAKVGVVDEEVLGLQVAMHYSMLVAVSQTLDQLVHETLSRGRRCLNIYTGWSRCQYALTLTVPKGTGVPAGPFPVLSIHFFKSVLRYSKT